MRFDFILGQSASVSVLAVLAVWVCYGEFEWQILPEAGFDFSCAADHSTIGAANGSFQNEKDS